MFRTKVVTKRKAAAAMTPPPPPMGTTDRDVQCNYINRVCMRSRLDGYEYCRRHILEDKNAPYKQCNFLLPKNGKRCANAASKGDQRKDGGFCPLHSKRSSTSFTAKQRSYRRRKPTETPDNLLQDLLHYKLDEDSFEMNVDGLREPTANALVRLPLSAPPSRISRIIDYITDSDSDLDSVVVDQAWRGNPESDPESIDSEQEDVLKHAGVYTAEEVTLITRDKLIRLQSLYIEQFKRLQHVLKEKRRKYLHTVKTEKESHGSVHASMHRVTPEEADNHKRLRSFHRYRRLYGVERLLHEQSKERRRVAAEGVSFSQQTFFQKCIFGTKGRELRCGNRALPFAKHCNKHILHDVRQVLYCPCNSQDGDCTTPVVPVVDFGTTCLFHVTLPPRLPSPDPPMVRPGGVGGCSQQASTDDICGLMGDVYCVPSGSTGIADLGAGLSSSQKEIWSQCLETPESKFRDELQAMDLTPGDLPPEQLLATN